MARKKTVRKKGLTIYDVLFGDPVTAAVTIEKFTHACGDIECPVDCPFDGVCTEHTDAVYDWLREEI